MGERESELVGERASERSRRRGGGAQGAGREGVDGCAPPGAVKVGSLNEYASLVFPSPLLVVPQVTEFKFRTQGLPVHWAPQSTRALPLGVPQASPADQAQCFNPAGLCSAGRRRRARRNPGAYYGTNFDARTHTYPFASEPAHPHTRTTHVPYERTRTAHKHTHTHVRAQTNNHIHTHTCTRAHT